MTKNELVQNVLRELDSSFALPMQLKNKLFHYELPVAL